MGDQATEAAGPATRDAAANGWDAAAARDGCRHDAARATAGDATGADGATAGNAATAPGTTGADWGAPYGRDAAGRPAFPRWWTRRSPDDDGRAAGDATAPAGTAAPGAD